VTAFAILDCRIDKIESSIFDRRLASSDQEFANNCCDLGRMRLQREVPGIVEVNFCLWHIALKRLGAFRRKNGSFLPHTAKKGGL
jgi:hypothetical protein